jgi:5-methylcytosine-specific restriction enzyme B
MLTSTPELEHALATFDRAAARRYAEEGEQQRKQILERFPIGRWPELPLERYAAGQEDSSETFCRWIEFRSRNLGSISGGSARKLLIYKRKSGPGWWYESKYRDEHEAWKAVRAGFVQALDLGRAGEFEKVDELEALRSAAALRAKTMHVYFPDQILPISSRPHLEHYLEKLGRPAPEESGWAAVTLNRLLLKAVRELPAFEGWSTIEIERFLYHWADPRDTRQIVKIAAGRDGEFWRDCLQEGFICVGWGLVGDLTAFEAEEELLARFKEAYSERYNGHASTLKKKAGELWTLRELEPGDIIIANQGTSRVLAVGEVQEPGYEWRPEREKYKHTVRVKWDTSYATDIPPQKRWALVTVAPVSGELYQQILQSRRTAPGGLSSPPDVKPSVDPLFKEMESALEHKRQIILYGPPGTGKTHAARRFVAWWLLRKLGRTDASTVLTDPAKLLAAEQALSTARVPGEAGHLTPLTFHPSYSYEDFVEGFRPAEVGNGSLAVRLEDGVFKRVCKTALANPGKPYLVLIDEINRANLAKVFGELITLLEKDKRGMQVTLPQSKETFLIPDNIYLLGTMNTADRSIKLLDAALRRRFAFLELMPRLDLLKGGKVDELELDDFLGELNRRIAAREGRERQIGHSFLLGPGGEPIAEAEEFARRFRQEILPLLQEYCYDDYGALADYLGEGLVEREGRRLKEQVLGKPEELVAALAEALMPGEAEG